ncbi:MAG: endonuclease domain-containing protein [Gammaproteobacteria bacterium]|nr:endonuclease domain-containing protein [Gammaproteobacteria bacterium]
MRQGRKPPLPSITKARSRKFRRIPTDSEAKLWYHLRAGRLDGLKFRRQHPLPPYVVDFYCVAAKLAVEVDGSQHSHETDAVRTQALTSAGIQLLRFWDNEVLQQTAAVLTVILNAARGRTLTPTPLPKGEG